MRNEQGMTLVELLAVLALSGMLIVLIGSVMINGMELSNRNVTEQQLQQEANYITEAVRNEYLKKFDPSTMDKTIRLEVDEGTLTMDGQAISYGYEYSVRNVMRDRNPAPFYLTIEKDGRTYTVDTKFSKLK